MDKDLLLEGTRDLAAYFQTQGYFDVRVTYNIALPPNGDELIDYDVDRGPFHKLVKLEIDGNHYFDDETIRERINVIPATLIRYDRAHLRSVLHSTEGQPYSDYNVGSDRDTILDYYFDHGYPAAKFEFKPTDAAEPNRVDLKFMVTPGERVYVRDVLVNGLERTHPDLVRNRISLKPGDPLSQNQINTSQLRLYDLGIFAKVNTAIQNPDGDEPTKGVLNDKRLAGFDLEAKGHFTAPDKFLVDPIHTKAMFVHKDGHVKVITYWCDVCSIRTYTPGPCWCCQKETLLDLRDPDEDR